MDVNFTSEEMKKLFELFNVVWGEIKTKKDENKFEEVLYSITRLIYRHGDDGYGDKPADMDRITYWFQHLNLEKFD